MNQARYRTRCMIALAAVSAMSASFLRGAQAADRRIPNATVHVEVFGPFGERIARPEIHLLSSDRKRDLARQGQVSPIADVPYGSYVLLAWDAGGGMAEREIAVNTKDVWVRIGIHFPAGDVLWPAGALVIAGEVQPIPSGGDWWARIEGVFVHVCKESPVSREGKFSVGGLQMGTYLVEVFEGSKLRHVEAVAIDPKKPETHLSISIRPS